MYTILVFSFPTDKNNGIIIYENEVLSGMNFDKSFLEDEVRLGFYIPSSIKQCWAAELEVLKAIDEVCEKENISYFADWGTFLGAVRHRGFIPWDDDLDLVMRREDYDKFLSVAPALLPEGYTIHTFRNEEGFREFHAVVINTEHARFDKEHYDRFHGFNYMCGIDIFVLDYVHPDEETEKKRVHDATFIIAFADGMLAKQYNSSSLEAGFRQIEDWFGIKFDRSKSDKELWIELYELADKKCAEVPRDASDTLTQMVPWGLKQQMSRRYKKSFYDSVVRLPFENTTVPVPLFYTEMLKRRYGDYLTLVKNAGAHDYPCFEKQINDFQKLLDFELLHFAFAPSLLTRTASASESWKDIVRECLAGIGNFNKDAVSLSSSALDSVCNAQQLAIDMGNMLEELKGKDHPIIAYIENYCEALYELYSALEIGENPTENTLNLVSCSFDELSFRLENDVLSHKEIVFLPYKASAWNSFEKEYRNCIKDSNNDVYVVPIPYYYKNFDSSLTDEQYDLDSYPLELKAIPYTDFSLEFHHPDMIFIQVPYDEYNSSFSIHPEFYCSVLRNYTEKLVYIPWFKTYDFDKAETRSYKNMSSYVTMPGTVFSDEVLLPSEVLKNTYIDKLSEWSGEEYRSFWAKKIKVSTDFISSSDSKDTVKTVLYVIGLSDGIYNASSLIEKIKSNLDIFETHSDKIQVVMSIGNGLREELSKSNPSCQNDLNRLIDAFSKKNYIRIIDEHDLTDEIIDKCDAYYGDAEYLAIRFSDNKKPVMIQNYSI